MSKAPTTLLHIKLSDIREPDKSLRAVDRDTEKFQGLVDSIRVNGVMNPINVREIKDPETGEIVYGLVDGLQRFTASKDAGKDTIPAQVLSISDAELLEAQIIANVHKIETKPVEYSKALLEVLANNPLLTRAELAETLSKTPSWISERLGLLKLSDEIGELVDAGDVGLSNAYSLAKLPEEEQAQFVERAIAMTPQEFAPTVAARVKELREAKREGRAAGEAVFEAVAILKSRKDIVAAREGGDVAVTLVKSSKVKNPVDAFNLALAWALTLDPVGVEAQKAKDEERKANAKVRTEKNKLEKRQKRAKEAAEKAAKLQKETKEDEALAAAGKPLPDRSPPKKDKKDEAKDENKAAEDAK